VCCDSIGSMHVKQKSSCCRGLWVWRGAPTTNTSIGFKGSCPLIAFSCLPFSGVLLSWSARAEFWAIGAMKAFFPTTCNKTAMRNYELCAMRR
jgi:hypothetical protein